MGITKFQEKLWNARIRSKFAALISTEISNLPGFVYLTHIKHFLGKPYLDNPNVTISP